MLDTIKPTSTSCCNSAVENLRCYSTPNTVVNPAIFGALRLLPDSIKHAPVANNGSFNAYLSAWIFVISSLQLTIDALMQHRLDEFDALVGNCCCHLIAAKCYKAVSHPRFHEKSFYLKNLKSELEQVHLLVNRIKFAGVYKNITFEEFLITHGLVPEVHLDLVFLVMSHLCCKAKRLESDNTEISEPRRIKQWIWTHCGQQISNGLSDRLIRYYQRCLSYDTMRFIQSEAQRLSQKDQIWASYVGDKYVLNDSNKKPCCPNLYSMQIVMRSLLSDSDSLIALKIDFYCSKLIHRANRVLFFHPSSDKTRFIPVDEVHYAKKYDENQPIYVIAGCRHNDDCLTKAPSDITSRMLGHYDLLDIILLNDLHYPQYPGKLACNQVVCEHKIIINKLSSLLNIPGFSLEDPSQLCIAHLYTDTLYNLVGKHETPCLLPNYDYQSAKTPDRLQGETCYKSAMNA